MYLHSSQQTEIISYIGILDRVTDCKSILS